MKRKCIYCGKAEDLSASDIIPDALTNARILNKNVCRIEHNNKFSDMFESKVIRSLAFITNELDIKSSKGRKYAAYNATITIDGVDYDVSLHGDNNIFDGRRVLKSVDETHKISSYDRMVSITGDESKVQSIDVNHIEIEKKVRINNEIFYDQSMYRMISKIAFEWYCAKNNIIDYHREFEDIISFITSGEGENPVSIIQESELYKILSEQVNLGSHTLFAFETSTGEINVVISLFGLIIYRVVVLKTKSRFCNKNFLFTELRTDSTRREIEHESIDDAYKFLIDSFNPEKFQKVNMAGQIVMMPKDFEAAIDVMLYQFVFNMIKCFDGIRNDAKSPNENLNIIFLEQLNSITQASTLQKKSIKRFVNEMFPEGHIPIQLNPYTSNKKSTVLFYAVYLVGISNIDKLDENIFQHLLKEKLPCCDGEKMIVTDEVEQQLKNEMMKTENYSELLEKGANIIKQWSN